MKKTDCIVCLSWTMAWLRSSSQSTVTLISVKNQALIHAHVSHMIFTYPSNTLTKNAQQKAVGYIISAVSFSPKFEITRDQATAI